MLFPMYLDAQRLTVDIEGAHASPIIFAIFFNSSNMISSLGNLDWSFPITPSRYRRRRKASWL
jgi:hypothetical protein